MTYGRYNFRQIKRTAVALLMITAIAVLLFTAFCPSAGAVGLVDDSVDAAHEYSRYPLENYQLDFYVDNGWDWLPWNWIDGIGKQVMYGLYCITNFIWTINLYLSNASGYLVQEAYGLDFISDAADEIGRNIQSIAGISPSGLSSDGFYAGFLLLIILIVGAYVAYVGLIKRETTKAVRAVMNMVMIFVLSGALIAYAPDCVKRLYEFSEDVSTASLSVGTKIVLPDAENSGADSVDLIRDSLFSIQVKQPWLLLQFGDTDTDAVGEERIDNILSASPSENNGEDRENAVKAEIEDNGNTNLTVTKTVNRLGTVFFLFLFNIGISVFVFLLTGMMIFSQVLFIIYAMFLPVSFVLSMAPTFEGSSRRAVIKLFNTILARAGITLVITVAFSISTMLYRIASGYPFFIIAFLQVVVFAGIYFKLGDLLSIFSLHDDGARGMGRYIMHRPRMFLHHQLHRLNRTMRAATASRPNDGGSAQNSRSSSASGGAYRYRSNRPNGGSSGASQPGAVHSLPETSAKEITSGGVSHTEGYADKAVSADAENRRPDAPAVYLLGAARQVSGQSETDMPRQAADSDSAAPDSAHRATESNARPMAVPVSHNYDISDRKNMKQAEQSSIHARPAVAAPAAKPVQEEGQRTAAKQPAPPQQERPVSPVHSTETQPHERPAAVAAPKLVSSTGNASSNPAPHKRPLAAQPVSTVQQAAPQTEAAKQPVHVGIRRTDAVNRPAVRQDAEGKPVMPMQENHAAREQDKPAVSRPAVKGSVVSKRASAKGKAGKAQRKNASSPKNRGDSNTSRTDSTKDGGGGR